MGLKQAAARIADKVLDPSVVLSFDRNGYRRHRLNFAAGDLDVELTGRVCAVTGANSGIGLATTRALAARGATVFMVCRNRERGEAALGTVGGDARLVIGDVSDFGSVRRCVSELPERIDVLVHNAGVLPSERSVTAEGLELTTATNLVGPTLMTALLKERMTDPDARLIWVSSGGMYAEPLRVDRLNKLDGGFDGVKAYAQTKRAQVVLSEELQRRWPGIASHCMHPGWADTPAVKTSIPRFHAVTKAILRTPEEGADTVIWLAAKQPPPEGGRFWFDRQARTTHFGIGRGTRESQAERAKLMATLEEWIGQPL